MSHYNHSILFSLLFFFNDTATTEIYTLSLHDALPISADLEGINITRGSELLTLYQFNTNTAKHYFCSRCGIYTHHQRRSNPRQYGVNVACLEGMSPFDFQEVPVYDGTRHIADGFPLTRAGTLIFRAAE